MFSWGGQAVAWWAKKWKLTIDRNGRQIPVTSQDIDFWGSRSDVISLAKSMERRALFPHKFEMTSWSGGVPFKLKDCDIIVDFLHSVPGLDTSDATKAL